MSANEENKLRQEPLRQERERQERGRGDSGERGTLDLIVGSGEVGSGGGQRLCSCSRWWGQEKF